MNVEYSVILLWCIYIMCDDILKNDLRIIKPKNKVTKVYRPFLVLTYHVLLLERNLFPTLYKILR